MSGLRLNQLRLKPWGCFEDLTLDFGDPGGLDLVLGSNAAGKSTMTRGIAGLLFGIEARSRDNHTFDYADLRIGAKLSFEDRTADVVRRKGRTRTLLDPDGQALPDDYLDAPLGGLRREVFESLLLVNNGALQAGGAELLQGKGEVGASLFAAAAGIASLHSTIEALDDAAKALFNPKGRKDAVHDALRDLKEAEKRLREATFRPQKHNEMERVVRRLEDQSEEIAKQVRGLVVERAELDRRRRVAPLVRRHTELAERLEKLAGTPELPAEARERRTAAENDLRAAESALERAQSKRSALAAQIEECEVDEDLIVRKEEIKAVVGASSAVIKGAEDRPRLEREVMAAEEKVRVAADAAGVDALEIEDLRRPPAVQGRLDEAVADHGLLTERRRASLDAVELAEKSVAAAKGRLAEIPEVLDPSGLLASAKAARGLGPVDRQLAEAHPEIERLSEAAELAFSNISPRPDSLLELAALAVPATGGVEESLALRASILQQERELKVGEDRLRGQRSELRTRQDEIEIGRAVPGPQDLLIARADREKSWLSIRESVEAGAAPKSEQMDEHQGRVARADSIVDEQLEGTAELERAARLELDRRTLAREEEALAGKAQEVATARAGLADSWKGLWAEVGFDPPEPEAAVEWLRRREEVIGLLGEHSTKEATAKALAGQVAGHRRSIEEQLAPFGVHPGAVAFSELLEIAEAEAAEAAARRRDRDDAQDALSDAGRRLSDAKADAGDAKRALAAWEAGWPAILLAVGLPPQTTPEVATTISRSVGEGLDQLSRKQELERRIAGIDRDRSDYAASVAALVADLADDLEDAEPTKAASLLGARLGRSQDAAAARKALVGQRASFDEDAKSAEEALLVARQEIEAVLAVAGCEELDDLHELEERSGESRGLRRELAELERQAVEAGERRFDEISTEVADLDSAVVEARLVAIEQEIEELGARRDELSQEVGAKESEIRSAELDTAAVTAREDIELIKGQVKALVRDYAAARLGSIVVRRAMERYRKLHENPLLARANELFGRITLGDFVELIVDHDDQEGAVLVGRQRDKKLKRVGQMSSGTREQLFLALRIAAIERYVATAGPVPVVFDDAFLESDEERSEKIFESLAELAASTQVIVLTHRRQQAALGEQVLGQGISILELESVAPSVLRVAA